MSITQKSAYELEFQCPDGVVTIACPFAISGERTAVSVSRSSPTVLIKSYRAVLDFYNQQPPSYLSAPGNYLLYPPYEWPLQLLTIATESQLSLTDLANREKNKNVGKRGQPPLLNVKHTITVLLTTKDTIYYFMGEGKTSKI